MIYSIHDPPDIIPLTAFCTSNRLNERLCIPQGADGTPAWFLSVIILITASLEDIRMYLDDATGLDDYLIHEVAALDTF